jgi:hypothetical protein
MLAALLAITTAGTPTSVADLSSAEQSMPVSRSLTVRLVRRCANPGDCLPLDVVQKMREEVERIWLSVDVRINWFDSHGREWRGHDRSTLMVFFEESGSPAVTSKRGILLGATHHPAERCGLGVARIWVSEARRYAATIRVNGIQLWKLPQRFGHFILARALGRALAHEIGHYLLGNTGHNGSGLMRAQLTPQELLEPITETMYGLDRSQRQRLGRCGAELTILP